MARTLWGLPRGRGFPHPLYFSSFLKYLDNSIWCTLPRFLSYFTNVKPHHHHHQQMEDANYLMTLSKHMAPRPPCSLNTGKVKACCATVSQSENCAWAAHLPVSPLPHLASKKCFDETHEGLWVFWAWVARSPCLAPFNKCYTFLPCNLEPLDWFTECGRADLFGSATGTAETWEWCTECLTIWTSNHRKNKYYYCLLRDEETKTEIRPSYRIPRKW